MTEVDSDFDRSSKWFIEPILYKFKLAIGKNSVRKYKTESEIMKEFWAYNFSPAPWNE